MTTHPEMNEQIVSMLSFRGDSTSLYAAGRIEELEAQVERLLERVLRAEAEAREAVAREAALLVSMRTIAEMKWDDGDDGLALGEATRICERCLVDPSQAAAALLERLEFLEQDSDHQRSVASQVPYHREKREQAEAKTENLRGALQAALLPLEAAADALVPEARVAEAAGLVEEALAAIREELEG